MCRRHIYRKSAA